MSKNGLPESEEERQGETDDGHDDLDLIGPGDVFSDALRDEPLGEFRRLLAVIHALKVAVFKFYSHDIRGYSDNYAF